MSAATIKPAELLAILTEAEARVKQYATSAPEVAARSAETVALCMQRLVDDGLTRDDLIFLASN